MSCNPSDVAFVDTETTGLDPERHQVWEVAVIVDGHEHVWQQRLADSPCAVGQPHWAAVDECVLDNTGIRERYDHDAALLAPDSYERFWTLVHGRHVVGACPWFDTERMHRTGLFLDRLGGPFGRDLAHHYHLIDVENLAVGYLHGLDSSEWPIHLPGGGLLNHISELTLPWDSRELSLALGVDPADFEPQHTALADARWAKALYEAIVGGPR